MAGKSSPRAPARPTLPGHGEGKGWAMATGGGKRRPAEGQGGPRLMARGRPEGQARGAGGRGTDMSLTWHVVTNCLRRVTVYRLNVRGAGPVRANASLCGTATAGREESDDIVRRVKIPACGFRRAFAERRANLENARRAEPSDTRQLL